MGIRKPVASPIIRRAASLLAVALLLAVVWGALPAHAAQVTLVQRPVEIKIQNRGEWKPLNVGEEVKAGDAIRTGTGGRCEITLSERRVFRIGERSEVVLDQLVIDGGRSGGKLRLLLGRIWSAIVTPLDTDRGETYTVETPTATMGIKGTRFDVDYDGKTKALQTTVLEGTVVANPTEVPQGPPSEISGPREIAPPQQITRGEWVLLVSANQKLIFVPGEDPKVVPITDEDRADEWVKFNEGRDVALR